MLLVQGDDFSRDVYGLIGDLSDTLEEESQPTFPITLGPHFL